MGSSIRNFLSYFQPVSIVSIGLLMLTACGDPEDPVVEATGDAPAVENFGVAYLKRPAVYLTLNANEATEFPIELDDANDDLSIGTTPGDVYIKDLSSGTATEINVTSGITAISIGGERNLQDVPVGTAIQNGDKSAGDVSDLEVSYDGSTLVFAMHEGMYVGLMPEEQPTWNIWIYHIPTQTLQRVMSDTEAIKGNDVDPHFLPDGRIVFTSDRRDRDAASNLDLYGLGQEEVSLNERGNDTAYAIHVMNPDGTNIKQITFNPSNELNPTVLNNGKILFSRWDATGPRNQMDLYTVNPDGTELDIFYGAHSHDTDNNTNTPTRHYVDAKQMPDGTLVNMFVTMANSRGSGEIISIDQANFVDYNQKRFTSPSLSTVGHVTATDTPLLPGAIASLSGSFTTPHPIYDSGQQDRILVAWDPCRMEIPPDSGLIQPCTSTNVIVTDPLLAEQADPLYSVWIYELDDDSRGWVARPEDGIAIVSPVALVNRPIAERPAILVDKAPPVQLDADMYGRNVGAISIKSVYDSVGNVAMVDRPLEPRNMNNLTDTERALIPMTTVQMDTVTGDVVTNSSDPAAVVPVDRTVADIPAIRLSTVTNTADQRVARFVRISKAVPRIDNNELDNDDFGRSAGYEMREILGYSVVEPDGSVYVEVPANIPFTVDILDSRGRSFMSHTNWMQVMPGEVRVCGGCHSPNDGQAPVNVGATAPGPFPNTVNTMSAEEGESMAETRARLDCLAGCDYPKLKRDLNYDDPWTDPTQAGRTADAAFSVSYNGLITTSPVSNPAGCNDTTWEWEGFFCRIAINFPVHIQEIIDNRCIACHNDNDPAAIPPGNLVLESQIDAANSPRLQALRDARTDGDRLASYEFLFISRPRMEPDPVTGGRRFVVTRNAADQPIADTDGDGIVEVIGETDINNLDFINPRPALVSQGVARARRSPLIYVLTGDPLVSGTEIATPAQDHTGILTDAELRMFIEWIDNGTQNFNGLNAALTN